MNTSSQRGVNPAANPMARSHCRNFWPRTVFGFVRPGRRYLLKPNDPMWQWPVSFIDVYLVRLQEMGRIDQAFAKKLQAELAAAAREPNSLMITPFVLEVIAEKQVE